MHLLRTFLFGLFSLLLLFWECASQKTPSTFSDLIPFKFYWLVKENDPDSEWYGGTYNLADYKMESS